jgi:phosphoserine phosphatase RsbU/P
MEAAQRIAARQLHDAKTVEMFDSIKGSAERMARLIEAVMDFARARLGGGIPVELKMVADQKTALNE